MKALNYLFIISISFLLGACNIATQSDFDRASKDLCDCTAKHFDQISPELKKDFIEASKKKLTLEETFAVILNKRKAEGNDTKNLADGLMILQMPEKVNTCLTELESKYKDLKTLGNETETIDKFMQSIEKQEDCEFLYSLITIMKASTAQQ
ncbi:MAG: hypothetical protein ACK5CY_08360 [Bacteroidia bacterium]